MMFALSLVCLAGSSFLAGYLLGRYRFNLE